MKNFIEAKANLRISYLGGGYDFPEFFQEKPVYILAEGLNIEVRCVIEANTVRWEMPPNLGTGLGSSAAKHLSYLRAAYPESDPKLQVDVAILLDRLQSGGYQDSIAASHDGLMWICLAADEWQFSDFRTTDIDVDFSEFRKLYRIPVSTDRKHILTGMQCRSSSFTEMQALVHRGLDALLNRDFQLFGSIVRKAWEIKKQWHPDITNETIYAMESAADAADAWGYKVCGAGGQGYLLVIGDAVCHERMCEQYETFSA